MDNAIHNLLHTLTFFEILLFLSIKPRHFKGFFIHPTKAFKFVHTLWINRPLLLPRFPCYFYSKMNGFCEENFIV
ncbi:predicted protein [Enterococcus casseliflavus EC30]|nr:predicted protein [Enterococcus casseliflavus EC30]EEV34754.1 predicted protein [Enterococcus casseliflavus EC10]